MGIRVEMRPLPYNASAEQEERAFKGMFAAFKRLVNEAGILTEYNRRQGWETEGQRKRRKRKEAAIQRRKEALQNRLRCYFGRQSP